MEWTTDWLTGIILSHGTNTAGAQTCQSRIQSPSQGRRTKDEGRRRCRRTNVGDGGLLAHQVFTALQGLVQHVQDTLDLVDVAIDGGLNPLAVKVLEPGALTELSEARNEDTVSDPVDKATDRNTDVRALSRGLEVEPLLDLTTSAPSVSMTTSGVRVLNRPGSSRRRCGRSACCRGRTCRRGTRRWRWTAPFAARSALGSPSETKLVLRRPYLPDRDARVGILQGRSAAVGVDLLKLRRLDVFHPKDLVLVRHVQRFEHDDHLPRVRAADYASSPRVSRCKKGRCSWDEAVCIAPWPCSVNGLGPMMKS